MNEGMEAITTQTEVANAVLRDTPDAFRQGVTAEQKAREYAFASPELRQEYITGFNLSLEFIGDVRAFIGKESETQP